MALGCWLHFIDRGDSACEKKKKIWTFQQIFKKSTKHQFKMLQKNHKACIFVCFISHIHKMHMFNIKYTDISFIFIHMHMYFMFGIFFKLIQIFWYLLRDCLCENFWTKSLLPLDILQCKEHKFIILCMQKHPQAATSNSNNRSSSHILFRNHTWNLFNWPQSDIYER